MHSRIIPLPLFFFFLYLSFHRKCYSSLVLPVTGNVNPIGYYHVTVKIGRDDPPSPYYLEIDTGSDLAWIQCDSPSDTTPAAHQLYKPNELSLVGCNEPLCAAVNSPQIPDCKSLVLAPCGYQVEYVDGGSSHVVLVTDSIYMQSLHGTVIRKDLTFGCAYNRQDPSSVKKTSFGDGVLGLGPGKYSILHQLQTTGTVARNVVGHCFSSQGNGYLFFGDEVVPSSGVTWIPAVSTNETKEHYSLGNVDLYLDGATSREVLPLVFDSGSTYTYFAEESYKALIFTLQEEIIGKQLYEVEEDKTLPTCWKGSKPFKSIDDVKNIFNPLMLSFANADIFHWFGKRVQFQLDPEAYLIISELGNVCLGILNGSSVGHPNINVIGDISFQDKIIIYDNEKQQIGWAPANCNILPNS